MPPFCMWNKGSLLYNSPPFDCLPTPFMVHSLALLKKVELFDVYEGDKLPAGKKSYAVNFILQDEEKTMGDKQIDAIMQKLIANIKKQLNAELR